MGQQQSTPSNTNQTPSTTPSPPPIPTTIIKQEINDQSSITPNKQVEVINYDSNPEDIDPTLSTRYQEFPVQEWGSRVTIGFIGGLIVGAFYGRKIGLAEEKEFQKRMAEEHQHENLENLEKAKLNHRLTSRMRGTTLVSVSGKWGFRIATIVGLFEFVNLGLEYKRQKQDAYNGIAGGLSVGVLFGALAAPQAGFTGFILGLTTGGLLGALVGFTQSTFHRIGGEVSYTRKAPPLKKIDTTDVDVAMQEDLDRQLEQLKKLGIDSSQNKEEKK
eukprot:TRINITY_DN2914_c0_g1_i2.p1 TRINITY_DN2914_c0_g1~~TRINITY_DN2914_c0_g1_i2.p1  ORF type:complete len:274 (-),score=68.23 TRINITY_DN2914_c0_g1_i2:39-860(-)